MPIPNHAAKPAPAGAYLLVCSRCVYLLSYCWAVGNNFIWMLLGMRSPRGGSRCSGIHQLNMRGVLGTTPGVVTFAREWPCFEGLLWRTRVRYLANLDPTSYTFTFEVRRFWVQPRCVKILSCCGIKWTAISSGCGLVRLPRARARGVVVSHPLSMREALGSIPSESTFAHNRRPVSIERHLCRKKLIPCIC